MICDNKVLVIVTKILRRKQTIMSSSISYNHSNTQPPNLNGNGSIAISSPDKKKKEARKLKNWRSRP